MSSKDKTLAEVQELSKLINETLKKHHPEIKIADDEIQGIIIVQFPKDHATNHTVYNTIKGKVCVQCTIDSLATAFAQALTERLSYVS